MERNTNALAKLTEDFDMFLATMNCYVDGKDETMLNKIKRIVAELAKVDNDQYGRPMFMDSKCAIIKCRAIALEGANDEN